MPRISVLMPAHNTSRYIRRSVNSLLPALPQDAEVVVLDDASSDGTSEVVESIRDPRVRVIRAKQNLGVAGAMRALLAQTDSELVARLDSDDLSAPGRFDYQLDELAGGVDASFGTLRHFGWGYFGRRTKGQPRLSPEGVRLALLLANPLGHSTMLAKRTAFGPESYPDCAAEDYVTWLDMAARGVRIGMSDRALASYRHHPRQLTVSAKWNAERARDQEVLRAAYSRLCEFVLGLVPSASHPTSGSWGEGSGADRAVVEAITRRIDGLTGIERDYVRGLLGRH